jgi:colanic acid/amylovoran biosynthesis glycosyltransferase
VVDARDATTHSPKRPRLLVVASTYPSRDDDGTPGFVRDLARGEAREFDTVVRVPGAPSREESDGLVVERFGYFLRRFEDLADGAILENLKARRSHWLQVVPFVVAETLAPRRAAAVTTMNEDMRRLVALGTADATTAVLPMGADLDAMRAAADGTQRDPGRILFVGRLAEKKGVAVLLRALKLLGSSGTRTAWTLEIVGDGPLRSSLAEQAAGLTGIPVTFHGSVGRSRVAAEYGRAGIVVFPSVTALSGDQGGLPVSLMEAMGAGCAIVASRIPGIDAAIVDGETGLLVPPGDEAALADSLGRLLADPALAESLGAAAAAAATFSLESVGARNAALLKSLLPRDASALASVRAER